MGLDSVQLRIEYTTRSSGTAYVSLDRDDMEDLGINPDDYDDPRDIDWYNLIDAYDYAPDLEEDESDHDIHVDDWEPTEEEDLRRVTTQPEPAPAVLVGRLICDPDGDVYAVGSVDKAGRMYLFDPETGEEAEDYGGSSKWDGVSWWRWYRSGEEVVLSDGTRTKVVTVGNSDVRTLGGRVYQTEDTAGWRWGAEVAEEESA